VALAVDFDGALVDDAERDVAISRLAGAVEAHLAGDAVAVGAVERLHLSDFPAQPWVPLHLQPAFQLAVVEAVPCLETVGIDLDIRLRRDRRVEVPVRHLDVDGAFEARGVDANRVQTRLRFGNQTRAPRHDAIARHYRLPLETVTLPIS